MTLPDYDQTQVEPASFLRLFMIVMIIILVSASFPRAQIG